MLLVSIIMLLQVPALIPQPVQVQWNDGYFTLHEETQIVADLDIPEVRLVAEALQELLEAPTTWAVPITTPAARSRDKQSIWLTLQPKKGENPEAYALAVTPNVISIVSTDARGLFYGFQTLRQLFPAAIEHRNYTMVPRGTEWKVPAVVIEDAPRFGYRGMHLDVGRHFMPVSFVKKYIDLLAMHKMNTFHWHLTEDQGWRIEIKAYPKLTEIGAWRDSTIIGPYGSGRYDRQRYGGFYTQDEIRDVVAYATERFITVVPEIEMPGHASAALAAYPEFGCTDGPYQVQSTWGIFEEIFCPYEETFTFLETVLLEVMELFPSEFIHIGGDEALKPHWKASAFAQDLMQREGLADEHELQSYFIRRIDAFLTSHGRRLVGWDEILEGGLAPGATVMSWRGIDGGLAAARAGHDAIMSPTSHCYFDYYQSEDRGAEPIAIGGFLPLENVYRYEPIPEELETDKHHHILGAQGNVWTEYMKTTEKVEYMAFPRAVALAEVVWSPREAREWEGFRARLDAHLRRFDIRGINYRTPD